MSKNGISYNHAYTMLGISVLSDGTRLVQMRNPWGHELWHGNWSDESTLWTDQFREETDWALQDDGKFYMSIEDYFVEFSATWLNWRTEDMYEAHYLIEGDESQIPGHWIWCGIECSAHTFELSSEVEQTIYLSGNVWPYHSYDLDCDLSTYFYHLLVVEGVDDVHGWQSGSLDI